MNRRHFIYNTSGGFMAMLLSPVTWTVNLIQWEDRPCPFEPYRQVFIADIKDLVN